MHRYSLLFIILSFILGLSLSMATYAKKSDHEHVREAVKKGEIIPLKVLLEKLEKEFDGDVLEIELDDDDGQLIYEFKVLRKNNKLVKFEIDAKTGRVIKIKQRGKR